MTTEFQEISISQEISIPILTTTTPESFIIKLEDAKEIESIKNQSPHESQRDHDSSSFLNGENNKSENSSSAESISNLNDDDEGFRTPTSSDHKIPAEKPCPPAPMKPKSNRWSRRSSKASDGGRAVRLYISDDVVEVIFSSISGSDLQHKAKRARKDDNGDE